MKKTLLFCFALLLLILLGCAPKTQIKVKSIEEFQLNEIYSIISAARLDALIESPTKIKVEKTFDFNGDGINDIAYVNLGTGGAYTTYYTFVIVEDNNLKMALFKTKNGGSKPKIFLEGASVKNEANIIVNESLKAITQTEIENDEEGNKIYTNFERYRFNSNIHVFEMLPIFP